MTEQEIKKKIIKKMLSKKEVEKLINDKNLILKLIEEKYIDDEKYVQSFIHNKTTFNLYGPLRIKRLLLQKGIEEELIEKYIKEIDQELIIEKIKRKNPKNLESKLYRNGFKVQKKEIN